MLKDFKAPRIIAVRTAGADIIYELVGFYGSELRYCFVPTLYDFQKSLRPAGVSP